MDLVKICKFTSEIWVGFCLDFNVCILVGRWALANTQFIYKDLYEKNDLEAFLDLSAGCWSVSLLSCAIFHHWEHL